MSAPNYSKSPKSRIQRRQHKNKPTTPQQQNSHSVHTQAAQIHNSQRRPKRNATNNNAGGTTSNTNNNAKKEEAFLTDRERLPLQMLVTDFLEGTERELQLPGLSNIHRKFLHRFAATNGLKTRSTGDSDHRVLHITRKKTRDTYMNAHNLKISLANMQTLHNYNEAVQWHLMKASWHVETTHDSERRLDGALLRSRNVPPLPRPIDPDLEREKLNLPIFKQREKILQLLRNHSVVIINGDTGSGKTTQVPQYLLEEACRYNRACRIIVTQPRRIAAITVASRVADERGEKLGETVGYQIRMESNVSQTTSLIYTTSGSFLRSIMLKCDEVFRRVSHLIIDEIHERDKDTDFTLIAVKEQLRNNKDLRVILMSATMDIKMLSTYFGDCPIVNVPGQSYDVKVYSLDDILYHTGYRTALMEKYLNSMNALRQQQQKLCEPKANNVLEVTSPVTSRSQLPRGIVLEDNTLAQLIDWTLDRFFSSDATVDTICEQCEQLQYYIANESLPVDVAHSITGVTPLIVACQWNQVQYVHYFLQQGANVQICDSTGYNAQHYAEQHEDGEALRLIMLTADTQVQLQQQQQQEEQQQLDRQMLLDAYQKQFNTDSDVDHYLIISLLEGLYRRKRPGAVMVFLPGYTDIIQQRELIQTTFPQDSYRICILHGQMNTDDQSEALKVFPERKIILSTNIGQTSITIPDLVYIIDSGKVKMKTYDSVTESSQLQSIWISQADACQRSGRAGRTQNGVCYRLYSEEKFHNMTRFSVPEFMRIPLTEICLYTKTLQKEIRVQDYLARALNPPSTISINKALQKLETLHIFDDHENVTLLGKCIAELPLDVQLGKCLIYSLFLRCYNSVLTIVAFHSVKDPYILPTDRTAQGKASFQRKSFAGNSYSDHVGILTLYAAYMQARHNRKRVKEFCLKNYLSQTCMELFLATRRQIADTIGRSFHVSPLNHEYNNDFKMVRVALAAGFYPNLALIDRRNNMIISGEERNLAIQRNSSLNPPGMKNLKDFIDTLPNDWILYYEKSRLGGNTHSINMNSLISPLTVLLLCGKDCSVQHLIDCDDDDEDDDGDDVDRGGDIDEDPVNFDVDNSQVKLNKDHIMGAACTEICQTMDMLNINGNSMRCKDSQHVNKLLDDTDTIISLDRWIKFQCSKREADQLMQLRKLICKQFVIFLQQKELNKSNKLASEVLHKLISAE